MKKFFHKAFVFTAVCAIALGAVVPSQIRNHGIRGSKILGLGARNQSKILSEIHQDWEIWGSSNAAEYEEAARDCMGNGDILLFLETQDNVNHVNTWLQNSDSSSSLYWVGGRYDVEQDMFIWENGTPFGLDLPWAPGEPKEKLASTRVAASTVGKEIKLKTERNTIALRYICKYL